MKKTKQYIGSQEAFEDVVNEYYDSLKDINDELRKEFETRPDDRQQCYKTGKECKYKCTGLCK